MDWMHSARIPVSWPRSHPLVFDRANCAPPSESEQPHDNAGFSDTDVSSLDDQRSVRSRENSVWRCLRCDSESYDWSSDLNVWKCRVCQGSQFYNATEPTRRETPEGCWTYVPRLDPPSPPSKPPSHSPEQFDMSSGQFQNEPNKQTTGGPPGDDDAGPNHETAESETCTNDPSVDPDTGLPLNRRRRRRRNAGRRATEDREPGVTNPPGLPTPAVADDGQILTALRQLLGEQRKGRADGSVRSDQTFDSRKGPAPGVKFRGGTPPAPPQWRGSSQDLRAFARWERRIEVWKLQIKSYMTDSEAALSLFTSLSGEAEAEIEHLDLKKVHHKDGIAYIVGSLREPLQQKQLFQKRKLLADYEAVTRNGSETMRQYVNRYKRIERDLESVGISSSAMYDSESRGNRLLERAKLAPELQRLVLIAAGNSLHFEPIRDALCMQFPDFRPSPQVYSAGGFHNNQNRPHRFDRSNSSTTASSSSSSSSSSGSKGSGKSHGHRSGQFHKKVFQTEHHDEELADIPEGEDEDREEYQDAEEQQPDENDEPDTANDDATVDDGAADALQELASVLTVTSKKLQSTILGRKFSGKPRSIEERKRTSSCSSCGQMGHWEGDAVCPNSGSDSKGKSKGKGGKSKHQSGRPRDASNNSHKKAFVVHCPGENDDYEDEPQDEAPATFHNFPTFVLDEKINDSYITEVVDFGGYMIIDTACQRTCLGRRWLNVHSKILNKFGLTTKLVDDADTFQFGAGSPQVSSQRVFFPAAFPEQVRMGVLLGASILEDVNIPFLASNTLMEKLGVVIDMYNKRLHVHRLNISFPLEKRHRHLVAKIVCFPADVKKDSVWKTLQKDVFWKKPDPELVCPQSILAQSPLAVHAEEAFLDAVDFPTPAGMASELAPHRDQGHASGVQGLSGDETPGDVWHCEQTMDDPSGESLSRGGGKVGDAEAFVSSCSGSKPVLTPTIPSVRKQSRVVLPVPEVPSKVQMDSRTTWVANSWIGKLISILSFAIAVLRQHPPEAQAEVQGNFQFQAQDPSDFYQETATLWTDRGRGSSDSAGASRSGALRLGLSRQCTGMLRDVGVRRRCGVPDAPLQDQLNEGDGEDYWEVRDGLCIRHHLKHRRDLFRPCHDDVPMPLSRFLVHCQAYIDYVDGQSDTMRYRWNSGNSLGLRDVPWVGSTVFQFRQQDTGSLLSCNDRRKIGSNLRQASKIQEAHHVLLTGKAKTSIRNRPRVDILETFAGIRPTSAGKRSSSN